MRCPLIRRATILFSLTAGAMLVATAIAFACVPQQGKLQVTNTDESPPPQDRYGTETEAGQSESSDWIVGDGDDGTLHFSSWCGDHGGHPTSAVWAEDGDELQVKVREAESGDVDSSEPCPDTDSMLPTAGEGSGDNTYIYLENGRAEGTSPDVYDWNDGNGDYPNGFWDFQAGEGRGCYFDGNGVPASDPINQDPSNGAAFRVNSSGNGTHTFDLDAHQPNNFSGSVDDPEPDDGASLLCVGDNINDEDPRAIFAPIVVMSV